MELLMDILRNYGPLACGIAFFIWRDWKRESELTSRVNKLEGEMRSVVLPMVENTTRVITQNTVVLERVESYFESQSQPTP